MYCRPKIPSLPRPSTPLKSSKGVIRLVWTIVSVLKVISSSSTPHRLRTGARRHPCLDTCFRPDAGTFLPKRIEVKPRRPCIEYETCRHRIAYRRLEPDMAVVLQRYGPFGQHDGSDLRRGLVGRSAACGKEYGNPQERRPPHRPTVSLSVLHVWLPASTPPSLRGASSSVPHRARRPFSRYVRNGG